MDLGADGGQALNGFDGLPCDASEDELNEFFKDICNVHVEPTHVKRESCPSCSRPVQACYCSEIPQIKVKSNVIVLQHPFEERRCLRTVPIAEKALQDRCQVIRGKKFNYIKHPHLKPVFESGRALVLFPGKDSIDLAEMPPAPDGQPYTLVALDGTWRQARSIYFQSEILQGLQKVFVKLPTDTRSSYVIRTQPNEGCMSTLEAISLALSHLEQNPDIHDLMKKPLEALCNFQIQNGAVEHQSKAYLIANGLYDKPINKRKLKRRMELPDEWE